MDDTPKKLVVFSNDPIIEYYNKGEIKERYYNPCNYFTEVHLISFSDNDIDPKKVQILAGTATLLIHPVGKFKPFNIFSQKKVILELIKSISPDVIRAYNPQIQGYFAISIGKSLKIPVVISIHADYSPYHDYKIMGIKAFTPQNFLNWWIILPYVISRADKIILLYQFLEYQLRRCNRSDYSIIYNRIDTEKFFREVNEKSPNATFNILCVGNQIPGKNPENLIKAISGLPVHLTLIGKGPLNKYLKNLAKDMHLLEKIEFIEAVPHSCINEYYSKADVYAIPIEYGGISIPVLEALSSSLPIVVPQPHWESKPELIGDIALIVDNTPDGFRQAFKQLIENPTLRSTLATNGRLRALEVDGKNMELKEKEVYKRLIDRKTD